MSFYGITFREVLILVMMQAILSPIGAIIIIHKRCISVENIMRAKSAYYIKRLTGMTGKLVPLWLFGVSLALLIG